METRSQEARPASLVRFTFFLNVLLCAAGWLVWAASDSKLVLAQAADSLLDLVAGGVLLVSARVASAPRDDDHPFGHQRAEPLGALVTAVIAGVLAFEILRTAVGSLFTGEVARLDVWVAGVLGAKLLAKLTMLWVLRVSARSPALEALRVDTRNDVAACASSLVGYALVRAGFDWVDAALAIPIGLYVGWNGFELARENLAYLMGAAPPDDVLEDLRARTRAMDGVLDVTGLRAQWIGSVLHVEASVLVGDWNSLTEGHDIGVAVQRELERHELVSEAFVHVDTQGGVDHG